MESAERIVSQSDHHRYGSVGSSQRAGILFTNFRKPVSVVTYVPVASAPGGYGKAHTRHIRCAACARVVAGAVLRGWGGGTPFGGGEGGGKSTIGWAEGLPSESLCEFQGTVR